MCCTSGSLLRVFALLMLMLASTAAVLFAQTTADTGSIVGMVRDPTDALVVGARIAITNVRTGRVIELVTNSSGAFNSGGLIPGDYRTRITARGSSRSKCHRQCSSATLPR